MALTPFSATWRNDVAKLVNDGTLPTAAYQEFTPVLAPETPGTFALGATNQDGFAVKLGPLPGTTDSLVWACIGLTFTPTIGTGTGDLEITGHPWSILNVSGLLGFSGPISRLGGNWTWPANTTSVALSARGGAAAIKIVGIGTGGVVGVFDEARLSDGNSHSVEGHVFYLTDA